MFNFAAIVTKAATYRLPITKGATLAALILLTTVAPATQAANHNSIHKISDSSNAATNVLNNLKDYCQGDIEAQTFHPKYQSAHQLTIDCMLTQLRTYQQPDIAVYQQYLAYKAQAWLSYAYHEDSIKSSTNLSTQALQAGATLLRALKDNGSEYLSLTKDIATPSPLMRPDLWATLNALKNSGGIAVAPRELAFGEVALVWATADHCENGLRQSNSYFLMADRWLEQSREAYINIHNSQDNVALEELINQYYKQYAPLESSDDSCNGQKLSAITNN